MGVRSDIPVTYVIKHGFLSSVKPECILVKTNTNKKFGHAKNSATVNVVFEADRFADMILCSVTVAVLRTLPAPGVPH